MNLEFTCPKCGEHRLEEVMADVTVTSGCHFVDNDSAYGDSAYRLEYDEQTNEDGHILRYQCGNCNCGHVILDDRAKEIDGEVLAEILQKMNSKPKQSEDDPVSHDEIVQRLSDALIHTGGEVLAKIWNDLCDDEIVYAGDSLFWVKKND